MLGAAPGVPDTHRHSCRRFPERMDIAGRKLLQDSADMVQDPTPSRLPEERRPAGCGLLRKLRSVCVPAALYVQ